MTQVFSSIYMHTRSQKQSSIVDETWNVLEHWLSERLPIQVHEPIIVTCKGSHNTKLQHWTCKYLASTRFKWLHVCRCFWDRTLWQTISGIRKDNNYNSTSTHWIASQYTSLFTFQSRIGLHVVYTFRHIYAMIRPL